MNTLKKCRLCNLHKNLIKAHIIPESLLKIILNDDSIPKIRLGNIDIRNNTIYNYKDNFDELIEIIRKEI